MSEPIKVTISNTYQEIGGGICWFCHWGWPKQIRDIYDRAKQDIEDALDSAFADSGYALRPDEPMSGESALEYGPAHVVWADENWDSAEWCLGECDDDSWRGWHQPSLEIVRRSLRELMALPSEVIDCVPKDYDGEHPENFPPPAGIECVR